jgi:hypothetical protein
LVSNSKLPSLSLLSLLVPSLLLALLSRSLSSSMPGDHDGSGAAVRSNGAKQAVSEAHTGGGWRFEGTSIGAAIAVAIAGPPPLTGAANGTDVCEAHDAVGTAEVAMAATTDS